MNENAANNIGGNVQDILDERMREMGAEWRFFCIKRLNGAENAGIAIRRKILSDITDPNSVTELVITPDDPRWALPFNPQEAENMGWRQMKGGNREVYKVPEPCGCFFTAIGMADRDRRFR